MEDAGMLIIGVILSVIGTVNLKGNISTVHYYNRRKVTEEDVPKYGKAVGTGTLIMGISFIACFVLTMIGFAIAVPYVGIASIVVGMVFILYAQFKYNKGIF